MKNIFKKVIFYSSVFSFVCSTYSKFYSQYGQDAFVYQYFKGKKDGFFVDVGAYDGAYFSNTYFFEKLGWQGICIEPQPEVFQNLCKNRSAICINACITAVPGIVEFTQIICPSSPVVQMLSGIVKNFEEHHAINVNNEVEHFHGTKKNFQIPGYPLADVLDSHAVSYIDYLSMDIEGGGLQVLQSIPFERITINVISVENHFPTSDLRSFLESKGFVYAGRAGDEIYVRKEFKKKAHVKKGRSNV